MGSVWVIVVAAGSGSRFGRPKQYEELGGRRVLDWSLATARATAAGPDDGVVVVVRPDRTGEAGTRREPGRRRRDHTVELGPGRPGGGARRRRRHRRPRRRSPARRSGPVRPGRRGRACRRRRRGAGGRGHRHAAPSLGRAGRSRRAGGGANTPGLPGCGPARGPRRRARGDRRCVAGRGQRVARWSSWTARPPTSRSPGRSISRSPRRCSGSARHHDHRGRAGDPDRTGLRRASVLGRRRPPARPGRRVVRGATRARRAQRRRRDRPRRHRRVARRRRTGRHRPALPRHRSGAGGCGLRRAAAPGRGGVARRGLVSPERRLHRRARGAEAGPPACGHRGPTRRRGGRAGDGQGQAGRGSGGPWSGRGDRLLRGRVGRPAALRPARGRRESAPRTPRRAGQGPVGGVVHRAPRRERASSPAAAVGRRAAGAAAPRHPRG